MPALEPDRAPVIVAGAAILAEMLAFYGLDAIEASERDILHGAALAAAELPEPDEGAAPPGRVHLLLGPTCFGRRLVLGQPALQHRPREDADEPSVLEHRHALEVVLLEELECLVERQLGAEREDAGASAIVAAARSCAGHGRRRRPRGRASCASPRRAARPSSQTKSRAHLGPSERLPASCALALPPSIGGSTTIASRTRSIADHG